MKVGKTKIVENLASFFVIPQIRLEIKVCLLTIELGTLCVFMEISPFFKIFYRLKILLTKNYIYSYSQLLRLGIQLLSYLKVFEIFDSLWNLFPQIVLFQTP